MRHLRRSASIIGAGALAVALLAPFRPVSAQAAANVDPNDRASVTEAYLHDWLPSTDVSSGWTGSVAACVPGGISDQAQAATLSALNFARSLEGLTLSAFDAEYSAQAQAAALISAANGFLSHHPDPGSKCWSEAGAAGASSSNLYLGRTDADAISGYLDDPGTSNTAAGHRRWLLDPAGLVLGHGSAAGADAVKVFGDEQGPDHYANPDWVPWPASGYFPVEMEPEGRWSVSGAAGRQWDFSKAAVRVQDSSGTDLPVVLQPIAEGYGADTLVWQVDGLTTPVGTGVAEYRVTVDGVVGDAGATSASYTVRLFDPEAKTAPAPPPLKTRTLVHAPRIKGAAKVGKKLSAVAPVYRPKAASVTRQWYRGDVAIPKATKTAYRLVKADRGKRISLRFTVPADDEYEAASSTAKLKGKVR